MEMDVPQNVCAVCALSIFRKVCNEHLGYTIEKTRAKREVIQTEERFSLNKYMRTN